ESNTRPMPVASPLRYGAWSDPMENIVVTTNDGRAPSEWHLRDPLVSLRDAMDGVRRGGGVLDRIAGSRSDRERPADATGRRATATGRHTFDGARAGAVREGREPLQQRRLRRGGP